MEEPGQWISIILWIGEAYTPTSPSYSKQESVVWSVSLHMGYGGHYLHGGIFCEVVGYVHWSFSQLWTLPRFAYGSRATPPLILRLFPLAWFDLRLHVFVHIGQRSSQQRKRFIIHHHLSVSKNTGRNCRSSCLPNWNSPKCCSENVMQYITSYILKKKRFSPMVATVSKLY